ncbi:DAK2 domain-containing protein [Brevibacterium sp. 5221]|uniref:DAK2 domain-containing protein n=1 Tax=Brevibacterium rongguiense TaxID=2695267 RepID=A0A6N9H4E9_9MICO|nr:DAK2 domain-containing protein [Brevibacterium rongguiense]MYM18636.1 DAK2 domain-containing protein [Brevibacterium rongguiense]
MSTDPVRLNGRLAARWARRTVERMRRERSGIDSLNVFPVPDGDTGSNMYHTVRSAYRAVEGLSGSVTLPEVVGAMATGALRGARGNSGLILSVALRGVADALEDITVLDAPAFAGALELAAARANDAIADPVHGTMLTVLHAMAEEAREQADDGADLLAQIAAVRARSRTAVAETTGQLDVLSDASVVDAGSTGIVELFDLLYLTVTGHDLEAVSAAAHVRADGPAAVPQVSAEAGIELVYLLGGPRDRSRPVKRALAKAGGTSVVVSWPKVHVHVPDEAAAERALAAMAPLPILQLRAEDLTVAGGVHREAEVLVLTRAPGLLLPAALAEATAVAAGDAQARTVLTGLRDDAAAAGTEQVVLASSQADARLAHAVFDGAEPRGPAARIVAVDGPVAALAALAVYDPQLPAEAAAEEMAAAAANVRGGELVRARRSMAGPVMHDSDAWLLRVAGRTRALEDDLGSALAALADLLMAPGGELITVIGGAQAPAGALEAARGRIRAAHPDASVDLVAGDDPAYGASIGVE